MSRRVMSMLFKRWYVCTETCVGVNVFNFNIPDTKSSAALTTSSSPRLYSRVQHRHTFYGTVDVTLFGLKEHQPLFLARLS
jgi:hypothetical protein